MIPYLALTVIATPAAMLAMPHWGAWMQAVVCALYGAALWYGMLYYNVKVAEWWENRKVKRG